MGTNVPKDGDPSHLINYCTVIIRALNENFYFGRFLLLHAQNATCCKSARAVRLHKVLVEENAFAI